MGDEMACRRGGMGAVLPSDRDGRLGNDDVMAITRTGGMGGSVISGRTALVNAGDAAHR